VYLKKLELMGFKSFPEKTQFLFNEGITCIVGPNGCGKTNLLDALRWVLGEQKTSLLRGNKMEEVIFAGTRNLKPLGMSEVSLHIENRNGVLPSQYNELAIARRLFRSGESEYSLNKVPCRLKDITDLFADTGLGSHAYAIIQQHMIDAILSDKAEERRFLFEEASGITKYKHRKKAAERKLEATEHDLLRLQDILSEVNTRVNSLKRQVNKAARYKKISDELKTWDLYLAGTRYKQLQEQKKELSLAARSYDDRRVAMETQLDSRFADLEKGRTTLTEMDHTLSDQANAISEVTEKAHQVETEISVGREKRDNLKQGITRNIEEIDALGKRSEVITEEKRTAAEEIERVDEQLRTVNGDLEMALSEQKRADDAYLQFKSVADDESARLLDLEGKISSGRTDSANIEEQLDELKNEIEQQNGRKSGLIEEKIRRRQEITTIQSHINESQQEVTNGSESLANLEHDLEETQAKSERLRDHVAELSSSYEATLARKNLLTEMVEHYEGYGSGVVAVFDVADRWVDITGTVADFIHPFEGYGTAIESALGETAQYILCQTAATAQEAVGYLRNEKAGRATFLILERLASAPARPPLPDKQGVVGWADLLVDCDERYRLVPTTLLGRTVVCENGETARDILDRLPLGYSVATVNGEFYTRDGYVTGGQSEELSLIGRKDEIKALGVKLDEFEAKITETKKGISENSLKIGELRQMISRTAQKLADSKDYVAELTSKLKEEQFKINAAEEITTSIDQRIDQLSQKLEKLKHRQYSLALDFDQLDREKATVSDRVQTKRQQLEEHERATHQAAEEVNRRQMTRVELESKQSHLRSQLSYYDEMLADIAANIEQKNEQNRENSETITVLSEQIVASEANLKELFEHRQELTAKQSDLRHTHEELSGQVNELEQQVKILRKERDELGTDAHKTEISMTEVNSRLEQLEEKINSEYEIDIREIDFESPDPEKTDEEGREHANSLRENLRKMGIVNLLALEEYEQQRERQEFLSKQLDDLITAKSTLKATIQKINQTAKMMFMETMEKARANFKQMYMELFTGGEADVILVDPTNPLESPIEIISRPRGKKPLTIAQLSGGERALTAISLLFALYMVKPSPFCFLDEIDAPLDDVNVGRFLTIVRKFSRQTQFIIITHNKITMEAADTLYGVTMEEPGVSKVVAVRFKKEGEDSADESTILDMHYAHDDDFIQAG